MFYKSHIFCCTNRRPDSAERGSCAAKGSEELRDYMKKRVKQERIEHTRVNASGCLDRCELGPCIVIYPEGVWYSPKTEADIDEILQIHVQNNGRVEHLMLTPDQK